MGTTRLLREPDPTREILTLNVDKLVNKNRAVDRVKRLLELLHQRRNTNLTKSRLDDFETSLINSELIIAELKTAELEFCEFPITNMRYSSLTPYRSFVSGLSSSNSATLASIYKGTDLAWENALSEVLAVLKIQYRGDGSVASFLASEENIRQLKYSSVARMEYNRRCIHEDVSHFGGIHSAPRARRIAKEVAIDYIRRFLDGETDRVDDLLIDNAYNVS